MSKTKEEQLEEEVHHVVWKNPLIKIVDDEVVIEVSSGVIRLNGHVIFKNGHYFDIDGNHYAD